MHFKVRYKEYMFSLVTRIVVLRSGLSLPLMGNERQTTTVTDGVHVTYLNRPLQMMRDSFKVFT
jgi:hypothetical protein